MHFSKQKFTSLSLDQQHRKCAQLLRKCIESDRDQTIQQIAHYQELCLWMGYEPLRASDLESLADRYHAHRELGGQILKEDRLLAIQRGDLQRPIGPPIDVTVYLEGLRCAHNIGNIIRSCECFGLRRVVLSNTPLASNQVRRAAMGCDQWIEVLQGCPLDLCPRPWIGLETSPQAPSLGTVSFPASFTLVLGNEEYGCSETLLNRCDGLLRIALFGRKNSLNVASAFACAAYEIRRHHSACLAPLLPPASQP